MKHLKNFEPRGLWPVLVAKLAGEILVEVADRVKHCLTRRRKRRVTDWLSDR